MKKHILLIALILASGFLSAYDLSLLDSLFTDSLALYGGNLFVRIYQADSIIYEYSAGDIGIDSIRGMASATKWISAGVIMAIADSGIIDLDDSLGLYLPIFSTNGKGHITIRQCFSMSSGLFSDRNYQWDPTMTLEEAAESIAVYTPLEFAPGTMLGYDGKGMQAAGRAMEVAVGMDWRDIADEFLFDRLGMDNTSYDFFGPLNPAVAGGINTTPRDYLTYLQMLHQGGVFDGDNILSDWAMGEMFLNNTDGLPVYYSAWPSGDFYLYGMTDPEYIFGSWTIAQNPLTGFVEEINSPGAFGTCPFIDRKRDLYGVIFTKLPSGGFSATAMTDLEAFRILRYAIDNSDPDNRVITISPYGENYLDFEILSEENLINFVAGGNLAWLGELDPYNGDFVSEDGRDVFIDNITPLILSNNGPEFAIDIEGWSLFYTKSPDSVAEIYMAEPSGDTLIKTRLTFTGHNHLSALVSQNPSMPTANVAFVKHAMSFGDIWWLSESDPSTETFLCDFERGSTPFRWMPNSPNAVHLLETAPDLWQLAIYDVAGDSSYIITDDPGSKSDPTTFLAPEYGYELLISAIAGQETLIVYRDTGGAFWTPISKIPIPPESAGDILQSPEFFEFCGKSYHSLHIEEGDGSVGIPPGEVWVFGIDDGPGEMIRLRCDNGLPDVHRTDPEPYVGAEDAFVFYNVLIDGTDWEIRRCRTGLADVVSVHEHPIQNLPDALEIHAWPNPFNSAVTFAIDIPVGDGSPVPISVEIYDVNGRRVATVTELVEVPVGVEAGAGRLTKDTSTGSVSVFPPLLKGGQGGSYVWQPSPSIGSGIYLVRATRGEQEVTKRIVYLK